MKITALLFIALALAACSPSDQERARVEARQTAHQVEVDAKKASREINHDLEKTRDKVHEALDEHR